MARGGGSRCGDRNFSVWTLTANWSPRGVQGGGLVCLDKFSYYCTYAGIYNKYACMYIHRDDEELLKSRRFVMLTCNV